MEGFATVEEALEELRNGKLILVTDDEDRENEGDFICAAEFATTENINFMAMHAKGLICMPMSAEYVKKLHFPQMVETNTDNHETAFTVSVDYVGTTTGISAAERSMTAMRCVAEDADRRISGVRDICFRFWQRRTECWRETGIRKQPWICAAWQA